MVTEHGYCIVRVGVSARRSHEVYVCVRFSGVTYRNPGIDEPWCPEVSCVLPSFLPVSLPPCSRGHSTRVVGGRVVQRGVYPAVVSIKGDKESFCQFDVLASQVLRFPPV